VPVPSPVANGVSMRQRPFTPQHQPLLLAAGITKVAHSQAALQLQPPQPHSPSQSVLQALPPAWQAVAMSAPSAPTWLQGLTASGSQHILHAHTGQQHTVSPYQHQLLPAQPQAVTNVCPVRTIPWDPSRPWRGPTHQLSSPFFHAGQPCWHNTAPLRRARLTACLDDTFAPHQAALVTAAATAARAATTAAAAAAATTTGAAHRPDRHRWHC